MENEEVVNPGEILTARCTYDSRGHSTMTKIGHTGGDEMCNLYLMFYTLSPQDDFVLCVDEQNAALTAQLPAGNDVPLPPNPELEHKAHGESVQSYDNGGATGHMMPVKKQDSTVRKRPGVDNGDYDANIVATTNNDGDGLDSLDNNNQDDSNDDVDIQPRSAMYRNGFVVIV